MLASIEFLFNKFASEATDRDWTPTVSDVPIIINDELYWIDLITWNEKDNLIRTYTNISFPHFSKDEETKYIKEEFNRININKKLMGNLNYIIIDRDIWLKHPTAEYWRQFTNDTCGIYIKYYDNEYNYQVSLAVKPIKKSITDEIKDSLKNAMIQRLYYNWISDSKKFNGKFVNFR